MKKFKLIAFAFVGMSVIMVSCSKSSSSPSTTVSAKDTVYHSAWITLAMTINSVQTLSSGALDTIYSQTITASAITQKIIDSGLVLSYIQDLFTNDGSIVNVSNYAPSVDLSYKAGSVTITTDSQGLGDLSGASFRYVVIPGTILTTNSVLKGLTKAQIKAANYGVISNAVGLGNSASN